MLTFYLDEDVPRPVKLALENLGHKVIESRSLLEPGAPDQVVATIAERDGAILISHDRDFRKLSARRTDRQKRRFKKLSIIRMQNEKPNSKHRIIAAEPIIVAEYNARSGMADTRMIIDVRKDVISVWR